MTPLNREDRITIAVTLFGLYTLGMAENESEKIDENCAMDNMGVPYYEEQLNEDHHQVLTREKFSREFIGPLPEDKWSYKLDELDKMLKAPSIEQIEEALEAFKE